MSIANGMPHMQHSRAIHGVSSHRRNWLRQAGAVTASGLLGASSPNSLAVDSSYRALVVVHLNGGNDGNNLVVRTDTAYSDYEDSRQNLAIPKRSLKGLNGSVDGQTYGLHPALAPLADIYHQQRLSIISNVGPLIEPATAEQVLSNKVRVPAFLGSHNDQTSMVQGWNPLEDNSGWAGRSLERFPENLRNPINAVTMDTNRTLVLGHQSPVSFLETGGGSNWGPADFARPETSAAQAIMRMARWQFSNDYEAEYARTFGQAVNDSVRFTRAFLSAGESQFDFGNDGIGPQLRTLASVLPVLKSQGLRRQVFLVHWGGFDTHANQRGPGMFTQDTQLGQLAKGLAAFDETNKRNGLADEVITLVISEFGRTVRPGSGGGSEHAWGSHWFAMGGRVRGGTVVGRFPDLRLGGPDDADGGRNGRLVPVTSSDQVGAAAMVWMGLPITEIYSVFPNLKHFASPLSPILI
jgi:uncharacterized protein (DUF1501 family)